MQPPQAVDDDADLASRLEGSREAFLKVGPEKGPAFFLVFDDLGHDHAGLHDVMCPVSIVIADRYPGGCVLN